MTRGIAVVYVRVYFDMDVIYQEYLRTGKLVMLISLCGRCTLNCSGQPSGKVVMN